MLPAYLGPALEFFDVFVRGLGEPSQIPRVRWNLAGTSGYRHAEQWPPASSAPLVLWATVDGRLSESPDADARQVTWTHDPDDLVPSSVEDPFSFLLYSPDERALAERSDVVGFVGDAVDTAVNLVGPVSVTLTVSSTGSHADVLARLYDLAPDGRLFRIARGQQTVDRAQDAAELCIDLGHVGYRLDAGHRLRLHVQSSDFPEYLPQSGTEESSWAAVDVAATTQTTTVGGLYGARLDLGVLTDPGPAHPLLLSTSEGDAR